MKTPWSDLPDTIGPYRLLDEIGFGGMGKIYRAYHERLERLVAIKCIRPDVMSPKRQAQFLNEARIIAQLSHPNIVQLYDIVEVDGEDWIIMELVEGRTLAKLLMSQRLDSQQVIALGIDIAKALSEAHGKGVVHRDLKAENVMITTTGRAKVLDFGLARTLDTEEGASRSSGVTPGTPRTMSPEQVLGDSRADHRSDFFSLGVLLYEAVAGTTPFYERSSPLIQNLRRICSHEQTPVHEINPKTPNALSQLIGTLLQKDPDLRPDTAESIVARLQKIGDDLIANKVLFVDDEPDFETLIRKKYRKQIRQGAVSFEFAQDGQEALQKIKEDREIMLVLTDIKMPRMDGLTLLQEISKLNRPILTILVTAYGDMKNIRDAMNLGAFDFLLKPIDFDDLEATRSKAVAELVRLREWMRLQEERRAFDHQALGSIDSKKGHRSHWKSSAPRFPDEPSALKARISGLRSLFQDLGPDRRHRVHDALLQKVVKASSAHLGVLSRFQDGELEISFASHPPEDTANLLVDCALDLVFGLRQLNENLSPSKHAKLQVKIKIGQPGTDEFDATLEDFIAQTTLIRNESPKSTVE